MRLLRIVGIFLRLKWREICISIRQEPDDWFAGMMMFFIAIGICAVVICSFCNEFIGKVIAVIGLGLLLLMVSIVAARMFFSMSRNFFAWIRSNWQEARRQVEEGVYGRLFREREELLDIVRTIGGETKATGGGDKSE